MSQAESVHTTRRSLLLGAAASFPATTVPAFALHAPVGDPALAERLVAADAERDRAACALIDAEGNFEAWKTANPEPELDDVSGGDGRKIQDAYRRYGDLKAEWLQRRNDAWREVRMAPCKLAVNDAEAKLREAAWNVTDFCPTSLRELIWKANLCQHEIAPFYIAHSIVDDLLALEGA